MTTAVEGAGGAVGPVAEIGCELLHGEASEAGGEAPAAHPAVETLAVLRERGRIEGLPIVAGQAELDRAQAIAVEAHAQPLHDEGRGFPRPALGLEPVALALTDGEPAPLGREREGEQEEAEGGGIHDLGAVVVDPPLAVHAVVIFPRRSFHASLQTISSSAGSAPSAASC